MINLKEFAGIGCRDNCFHHFKLLVLPVPVKAIRSMMGNPKFCMKGQILDMEFGLITKKLGEKTELKNDF